MKISQSSCLIHQNQKLFCIKDPVKNAHILEGQVLSSLFVVPPVLHLLSLVKSSLQPALNKSSNNISSQNCQRCLYQKILQTNALLIHFIKFIKFSNCFYINIYLDLIKKYTFYLLIHHKTNNNTKYVEKKNVLYQFFFYLLMLRNKII